MNKSGKSSSKSIINPALKITNFTKFASQVFEELNEARTQPSQYAKKVKEMINNYNETEHVLMIGGCGMYINEGKDLFQDAINFLKSVEPQNPLSYSEGISKSADELLTMLTLHDGVTQLSESEESTYNLEKRMNYYGAAFGELDELIDYGSFDPCYVIMNFILCDGDKLRKEREIIFNPTVKYVGLASGVLPSERVCTVINFSEYYYNPGETVPKYILSKYSNLDSPKSKKQTSPSHNTNISTPNVPVSFKAEVISPIPIKRKSSVNIFKEKENKYKDYIYYEDQVDIPEQEQNPLHSHLAKTIYLNNINENEQISNSKSKILTPTSFKNTQMSQISQISPINPTNKKPVQDESDTLPEGVQRIKITEKLIKNKTTNLDEIVVKKQFFYSDGRTESVVYKK